MFRRILLSVLFVTVLLASTTLTARAATPTLSGTFTTTQNGTGTIKYTMVKAMRLGSQGNYVISGRTFPGVLYAIRGGSLGMAWFYGSTGITAGSAVVSPTGVVNTYSGPIQFVDQNGNVIDTGTVTITMN